MEPGSRRSAADDGESFARAPAQPDEGNGDPRLVALRDRGAQHLDPGRFRYLEALARRAGAHEGALRELLDQRLAQALTAYGASYDAAVCELDRTVPALAQQYPQAAQELQRLHAEGNARAVHRLAARLEAAPGSGPLADLVRHMENRNSTSGQPDVSRTGADAPLAELKTVQRFRATWSRLRVDAQLTRSQEKVPENPGPLNSHLLVQRSLRRLQELSPAYLQRFMAHVDVLVWLEGAGVRGAAVAGKGVARGRGRAKARASSGSGDSGQGAR